jgi:hypothetical protein
MSSQEDGRKPEQKKAEELSPEELGQVAGGITFVFTPNAAGLINETGDKPVQQAGLINETGDKPVQRTGLINEILR